MSAPEDDAFIRLVEPHRPALRLHCYRMLGSPHDAEEAVQEAVIRAWQARASLADHKMLRPWLYRIATNVCFDELKGRKNRPLPSDVVEQGDPAADPVPPGPEALWLEPCPNRWVSGTAADPAASYELRESVAVAFVAALQCLSARQRAVLLLRDVLGMSAEETADALEMTVSAADSALHRARSSVPARAGARDGADLFNPDSDIDGAIVGRYVRAWQDRNIADFVALLHDDVLLTMPPSPTWLRGKSAVATFYETHAFAERRPFGFVRTAANGQPAFGFYVGGQLTALHVLEVRQQRVAQMHHFGMPTHHPLFDLPAVLPD